LPFLAVNPEFSNIGGRAASWSALARWDPNKQRLFAEAAAPWLGDPRRHVRFYADARSERWRFDREGADVPFRKIAAGAEFEFIPTSRLQWRTGFEASSQRFSAAVSTPNGAALSYRLAADYGVIRRPARRFSLTAGARADLGRLFGPEGGLFRRGEASLAAAWFPQARGSDYETRISLRGGAAAGALPVDEMYQVGVERDTGLWLRGHPGTIEGRKGSALIGRGYALANLEWFKRIHEGGLLSIHAGPFADIARVRDALGRHRQTLFTDPGVQLRIRVLNTAKIRLSYSRGDFYAALAP
jgi:hypothetical protein